MNDTLEIAKKCGGIDITQNDFYECYAGEIVFEPEQLQSFREEIERLERERFKPFANFIMHNGVATQICDDAIQNLQSDGVEVFTLYAEAIRKGDKP